MKAQIIRESKRFLKESFVKHPHYSFNDWRIMYDHSILVMKFALRIAKKVSCDTSVLSIGALLHDIGKTFEADEEILRKEHKRLAYPVSKEFLEGLGLTLEQKRKLEEILSDGKMSVEKEIIEDADTIAFFADKKLQGAFKMWVQKKELKNELKRKVDKFNKLQFPVSTEIARNFYTALKKEWAV